MFCRRRVRLAKRFLLERKITTSAKSCSFGFEVFAQKAVYGFGFKQINSHAKNSDSILRALSFAKRLNHPSQTVCWKDSAPTTSHLKLSVGKTAQQLIYFACWKGTALFMLWCLLERHYIYAELKPLHSVHEDKKRFGTVQMTRHWDKLSGFQKTASVYIYLMNSLIKCLVRPRGYQPYSWRLCELSAMCGFWHLQRVGVTGQDVWHL